MRELLITGHQKGKVVSRIVDNLLIFFSFDDLVGLEGCDGVFGDKFQNNLN